MISSGPAPAPAPRSRGPTSRTATHRGRGGTGNGNGNSNGNGNGNGHGNGSGPRSHRPPADPWAEPAAHLPERTLTAAAAAVGASGNLPWATFMTAPICGIPPPVDATARATMSASSASESCAGGGSPRGSSTRPPRSPRARAASPPGMPRPPPCASWPPGQHLARTSSSESSRASSPRPRRWSPTSGAMRNVPARPCRERASRRGGRLAGGP